MMGDPSTVSQFRSSLQTPALLVVLYLASISLHLYFLRDVFRFPHVSSDEVKYVSTGESIRMGRGYTLRGEFNSTAPPVFPAFIALAHSIGSDPRVTMFGLSSLLMCFVIFPAFALGKLFGLDTATATILAAAASVLPHTFYAATYMAEIVQYPAYLIAFYLAIRWLDNPSWRLDIVLGCSMGLSTLTKLQGNLFVGAFVIAVIIIALHSRRTATGSAVGVVRHSSVVLITPVAIQESWNLYKAAHAGTAFGAYGTVLANEGLQYWTMRLSIAYFADFLLAPGLITAVLLFYWARHNGNYPRTVFVLAVLVVQIVAVSILNGGLTGWLSERLFLYALPITAILAAEGLAYFKRRQTFLAGCALLGFPLLLAGALMAYPFSVSSIIEAPWANALGTLAGIVPFSRVWLVIASLSLSVLIASILLRARRSAPLLFAGYILLFYGLGFVCSSIGLAGWTALGLRTVAPILTWLSENRVPSGHRLLIAGNHGSYEDSRKEAPPDERFVNWTRRMGLNDALEWQIETIGRFDVRMIPAPKALTQESHPGDYLLTAAAFDGLSLESLYHPFYLYRIDKAIADPPSPRYRSYIPADRFYTLTGRRGPEGAIVGAGTQMPGYLVYGPYIEFSPGQYRIKFNVAGLASESLLVDVAGKGGRVLMKTTTAPAQLGSITFSNDSSQRLEFRIFGASDPAFRFNGVDLEWLSDSVQPAGRR